MTLSALRAHIKRLYTGAVEDAEGDMPASIAMGICACGRRRKYHHRAVPNRGKRIYYYRNFQSQTGGHRFVPLWAWKLGLAEFRIFGASTRS